MTEMKPLLAKWDDDVEDDDSNDEGSDDEDDTV